MANFDFESRAPDGYVCPICAGLSQDGGETYITPDDIVYTDDLATALINSFFQKGRGDRKGNKGHVIVVPNAHYENLYVLPTEELHRIAEVAQMIAGAIKLAYKADGITIRQNNEPASEQHAFHYHLHIYPRYDYDSFNQATRREIYLADPKDRAEYARKLREQITGETTEPADRGYLTS